MHTVHSSSWHHVSGGCALSLWMRHTSNSCINVWILKLGVPQVLNPVLPEFNIVLIDLVELLNRTSESAGRVTDFFLCVFQLVSDEGGKVRRDNIGRWEKIRHILLLSHLKCQC